MSNARLIWGGILLPIIGIFMMVVTFKAQRENERLDREGVTVVGEIVGGEESRGRRGRRSYKLDVTYSSEDRRVRHQKTLTVPKEVYEQAGVAGEVPVTFLLSDPDVARAGERRDSAIGFVVGPVLALVGAGMLAYFVRRRARG